MAKLLLFWISLFCVSRAASIERKKLYIGEPIHLNWTNDESPQPTKIAFYSDRHATKKTLGVWTLEDGFTADPFFLTNLEFQKSNGNIRLILVNPITNDYDATYVCQVSHVSGHDTQRRIQIKLIDPEWLNQTDHLKSDPGNEVTFVYKISYKYSSVAVMFHKYNSEKEEEDGIAYTLGDDVKVVDKFKEKATLDQTMERNDTFILTLRDIKPSDEGYYSCQVIFTDGRVSNKAYTYLAVNSFSPTVLTLNEERLNSFDSAASEDFRLLHINIIMCLILYILLNQSD